MGDTRGITMILRTIEIAQVETAFEAEFGEKELGDLNLYLLRHSNESIEFVTMEQVEKIFNGYDIDLPSVTFDNNNYSLDLCDFIREWCTNMTWEDSEPTELNRGTIDTDCDTREKW